MSSQSAEIDACDFCHLPEHRHPVDGCPGFEPEVVPSAENDALTPGQKCPMSGRVISFPNGDEWVNGEGTCWKCGGATRLRVRGTDLFPYARCLTHKVPRTRVIPPGEGNEQ